MTTELQTNTLGRFYTKQSTEILSLFSVLTKSLVLENRLRMCLKTGNVMFFCFIKDTIIYIFCFLYIFPSGKEL